MNTNVRPVFTFDLNYTMLAGKITVGKYDGTHPCLTAVTNSDKILIHSPHRRSAAMLSSGRVQWGGTSNKDIAILNISQTITTILATKLLPDDEKDVLIIGSPTHLLVYHVYDNKDIFYKECVNGINSIAVGSFYEFSKNPIILVGGNCSVNAFDHSGNEIFWVTIGDNVTDMILYDFNNDGRNELIVGSEDFLIRVYQGTNVIQELYETEIVTILSALPDNRFAYGIANGTLGVYEQDVRLWRVKSKNNIVTTTRFDLLGLGTDQLITGWSNGKVDARSILTGEVLFKDHLKSSIAGFVQADYRGIGKVDLICVTVDGELRGYAASSTMIVSALNGATENDMIRELFTQKQGLLLELRHYEENAQFNSEKFQNTDTFDDPMNNSIIPANTRLQIGISGKREPDNNSHVQISISTNNTTIIRAIMIFAEGIFEGETLVVHPKVSQLSNTLTVPIRPPKDVPVDIHIKAFVGYAKSIQFHVFELTRQLPKFSMYALLNNSDTNEPISLEIPESFAEFQIKERLQRICIWINQNFLLPIDVEPETGMDPEKGPDFILQMICLRDSTPLRFVIEISGKVKIFSDNLVLVTELIQSLCKFLNLEHLNVKANFPKEETRLKELMEKLTKVEDVKLKLSTDIADRLGQIRALVIRAEDARINNLHEVSRYYNQLRLINETLIAEHNIRVNNYKEVQSTMRDINLIVQRASRLRVGSAASSVINYSKTAIRNNNMHALIKILRTGES